MHYQNVALAISCEWPDVYIQHADKFIYGQVHYRDNFPGAGVDGSDDWFICVARGHARQGEITTCAAAADCV